MTVQELVTPSPAPSGQSETAARPMPSRISLDDKKTHLDQLMAELTVEELGMSLSHDEFSMLVLIAVASQLLVISGNWIIGEKSDYSPYGM